VKSKVDDIFTPQGRLSDVKNNPNIDFLMNIFSIPRAFGVSGFGGGWSVGQHSFATAALAIYWAKYNKFSDEKRDKLVILALLHDIHESVTGDILPMFKTKEVKKNIAKIQSDILKSLNVQDDLSLKTDLKIIDMIAFLYEIKQVSPNLFQPKKLELAKKVLLKQRQNIKDYCKEKNVSYSLVNKFITSYLTL